MTYHARTPASIICIVVVVFTIQALPGFWMARLPSILHQITYTTTRIGVLVVRQDINFIILNTKVHINANPFLTFFSSLKSHYDGSTRSLRTEDGSSRRTLKNSYVLNIIQVDVVRIGEDGSVYNIEDTLTTTKTRLSTKTDITCASQFCRRLASNLDTRYFTS